MPSLLDQIAALRTDPKNVRGHIGTVTGVATRTVDVDMYGDTVTGIPFMGSTYPSPIVGDTVLVLSIGSAWLALASFSAASGFPALLSDAGFETSALGYAVPSTYDARYINLPPNPYQVVSSPFHSGSRSTRVAVKDGSVSILQTASALPCATGQVYRIGCWARATTVLPANSRLQLGFANDLDSGNVFDSATLVSVAPSVSKWSYYASTFTVPSNWTTGAVVIVPRWVVDSFSASGATGASVYLDDLTFERVS